MPEFLRPYMNQNLPVSGRQIQADTIVDPDNGYWLRVNPDGSLNVSGGSGAGLATETTLVDVKDLLGDLKSQLQSIEQNQTNQTQTTKINDTSGDELIVTQNGAIFTIIKGNDFYERQSSASSTAYEAMATNITGFNVFNTDTVPVYLKFYINPVGVPPNPASDTPFFKIQIPPAVGGVPGFLFVSDAHYHIDLSSLGGYSIFTRTVTGYQDTDTTNPGATVEVTLISKLIAP